MTRQQQLKNEARKAEQRSDWARAIELYTDAIQLSEDRGSGDAGMYNRIGDLYLRQGDSASAVEHYQEAVDRYAASGLHTSAIALCNKILRIAPDQDEIYGRLARLHASTGLLAEARSAFLQFADKMRARNQLSDALETVQDLVSLTGDEELRTAFADQLVDAGLTSQALAQLRLVYEDRIAGGRNAQDIRERIVSLDPDADPVAGPVSTPARAAPTAMPEEPPSDDPGEFVLDELLGAQSMLLDDQTADPSPPVPAQPPAIDPPSPAPDPSPSSTTGDMQSVLTEFRSQVLEIVEETDYAVHYDLGVAYMGMGLLDEAIGEFQLAIQSPAQVEAAHSLLGECLRQKAAHDLQPSVAGPETTGPDSEELVVLRVLEDPVDEPVGETLNEVGADTLDLDEGPPDRAGEFDLEPPADDGFPESGTSAETEGFVLGHTMEFEATPEATADVSPEPDPMPAEPETVLSSDASDDLANMLFQARLAQHRLRQAAEEGRVDHAAHLDLGRTYQEMGLFTEAVEDYAAAAGGPRGVAENALRALESLVEDVGVEAIPMREALSCLLAHGRTEAAEAAGRAFLARPGIGEADRQTVQEVLPGVAQGVGAGAEVPPPVGPADGLEGIMAELDAAALGDEPAGPDSAPPAPPGAPPTPSEATIPQPHLGPAALFGEAEGLREAGRLDEAVAHYYRALELYEKERDALSAIRVVDRLLGLRPDDVVLHHQKTELAIMTNDRELLISAYLDLGSCLRRQNGLGSARTVYGRILDLDPGNAEARAGIAALDAAELTRERQRTSATREALEVDPVLEMRATESVPEPHTSESPGTEFDEMFDELRQPDVDREPDYESHYELGVAFRQMQMWDEAAREFKLAVQGMAEPLPAYEMLGEALNNLRRYEEARRVLSTAVDRPGEADASKIGILFHLGVAHMRAGDPSEARACLERVVGLDPTRTDAAQLLSAISR